MKANRFILGTVQFGMRYGINNIEGQPTKTNVFDILSLAHEHGIEQLDSADMYGDAQTVIGDFIRTTGNKFQVNTKFRVLSDESIEDQLTHTLNELSLEQINVYFYHRYEEMQAHPQVFDCLHMLKQKDLIKKTGVSVYTNAEFQACIDKDGVDVIQLPFNLLDNHSRRGKLIAQAKEKGKEIQVRSVFLQGLFFKQSSDFPETVRPLSKYVRLLQQLASVQDISMHALALNYVLSKPYIDSIIIGVDSKEQLEKNIASQRVIDKILEQEIDKIQVQEESLLYPFNWR